MNEKQYYSSKMLNIILVLALSPSLAFCKIVVTPDLLVPIKQFNEACGYEACPVPMTEEGIIVHIVPHTHYELAFQRNFAEHYVGKDRYTEVLRSDVNMKRTLDGVITELWSNANRKFTLSDMPYFFHWWSQRDENVRQMVYTLIRQGRLTFVGGGWSMNDEATTNYHAIIDSFTYSLRKINATFWECGRPLVAWQADVFGHSREFASLVAQMGYDALFINPISFDDELARMRRWALEMLWRGSDDLGPQSDIFTHKLFDGYWSPPGFCFSSLCLDPLLVTSDTVFGNVDDRAKAFMDSMYNRQAPNYNSSHVMVIMGMLLGYHDAPYWFNNIDALITAVNSRAAKGKQKMYLMYSNPACYAKAVKDSEMPLETKQDDFFPVAYDKNSYLTGLYTTSPSIKFMAKEIMVYLQMCKQLRVFAELGSYYNEMFEEMNWVMGAFQDHDIITGYMKDEVRSYYVGKMYLAVQRSTLLLQDAWNKLRKCPSTTVYYRCSFNISRCHHIIGDNYFLQIQNVLAWPVTIPVRYPLQYYGEEFRVYDPKGNLVKSTLIKIPASVLRVHSRVNTSNYELVFIAKDLPPLGFRSYFIQRVTETNRYKRDTGSLREDPQTTDKERNGVKENPQEKNGNVQKEYEKKDGNITIKNESDSQKVIQMTHSENLQKENKKENARKEYEKEDGNITNNNEDGLQSQKVVAQITHYKDSQKKNENENAQKECEKEDGNITNKNENDSQNEKEVAQITHDKDSQKKYEKENAQNKYEKEDGNITITDEDDSQKEKEVAQMTRNKDFQKENEITQKHSIKKNALLRNKRRNSRTTNKIDEDKPEGRPRIPLIKNMRRKPNKKYLIRQTNPLIDDQSLLYDIDEEDDDTEMNNSTNRKENVTVLLENDFDEIRMQQIDGDRPGDIAENEAPADLPEQQTINYQLPTTKKEPITTKKEPIIIKKDKSIKKKPKPLIKKPSSDKKDKYTTTIIRNPVVTSSQILEQLEEPTLQTLTHNRTVSKNTITPHDNVTVKSLNVTNTNIHPKYWEEVALDLHVTNDTITPRHWNKVDVNKYDVNTPRPPNKDTLKKADVTNDTIEPQHWNKVALKEINVKSDSIKPKKERERKKEKPWNKVILKEIDVKNDTIAPRYWSKATFKDVTDDRRVNSMYDTVNDMIPNRTPSPKLVVTPTHMYNIGFKESSTNNVVREDILTTDAHTDINKEVKKVEEENFIAKKEHPNKEETLIEPIQSEDVGDTIPIKESDFSWDVKESAAAEAPLMDAGIANEGYRTFSEKNETIQEPKPQSDEQYEANVEAEEILDLRSVNNTYIENKYIRILIDPETSKVSSVTLSNGVQINLDIQFYYYASDDPEALNKAEVNKPGAVLFRAMENTPIPILDFLDVQVFKSDVVEEAHFIYSTWTSFVIRLYEESPVIEVEWLIGPIPVEDRLGKEVFVRYLTNLVHEGVFFTDSNGRQTMKRIRHMRPQFESMNLDPVAGNFYPVTSKISIQDFNANVCFSVFVDRAQGGTSLADGEVDLMLNRRILTDDSTSETFANDTELGKGIVIRGKHYLYISKADHKPYRIFEKKFAKEVQLAPQILVSRPDPYANNSKQIWFNSVNEVSFLKNKLPIGIHLLTLEDWGGDTFLLRLENYLERNDTLRGRSKIVYIQEMFTNVYITHVRETTLGANRWMDDRQKEKQPWPKKEYFVKSFNDHYGVAKEVEFLTEETDIWEPVVNFQKGIKFAPQQIRTFVCNFDYVEL